MEKRKETTKIKIEDCIHTTGMLDSGNNASFLQGLKNSVESAEKRFMEMADRLNKLNDDLCQLQSMAAKIAERYSMKLDDENDFDGHQVLQVILDHKLDIEDIQVLCRLIDYAFEYILWRVNKALDSENKITTLRRLHVERHENSELYRIYDDIAFELKFNNCGNRESDIYQLWIFRKDFSYAFSDGSWKENARNFFKFPENEKPDDNLLELIAHAEEKVREDVDDTILENAFSSCIRIVRAILADQSIPANASEN